MSRAGQAGEVGSVFRCAVATHLAVHGLRSRSVLGLDLPDGVDPVQLDFETDDPTDDLRITFSDGRRAYLSAKRKVSRGRPLEETVAGWSGQASTLGPDDLLIIAGEDFVGPAKSFDRVLRRHRAGLRMETKDEQEAFNLLADLLSEDTSELILNRARVLHLPHSTGVGTSRDFLAALMDLVIANAQGHQAVTTLSDFFHQQAGEALGSKIDSWVMALTNSGLTVIADQAGPAGMRIASQQSAVSAYLDRLKEDTGRLDLSLLAEDLPPIIIEDLVDGLEIDTDGSRTSAHLLQYIRRWRRMLIVGQPGAGKSVALREIAAHCASHPHAPVPIRASLPRLLKNKPERLTIDSVIHVATTDVVDDQQRAPLAEYLAEKISTGNAIILCDGLDECGVHAPWVAQQLANLVRSLHSRTGFVLATRANAQIPATRLGLPRVELAPPRDLSNTVDSVLVACAEARVPEHERDAWLTTRRAWIRDARDQHRHLLKVPLLAILLALICASTSDADLPKGRATLLHGAVEQSVQKWERSRGILDATRPWSPALTTAMLLSGFTVLGRMLEGGETPMRTIALRSLTDMLSDDMTWAMPPAQALEVAEDVLRFWDEHVAVFVVNGAGELTSRSKVFAEIATAMWASSCEEHELDCWLDEAIIHTDSDGAIALAAGLNSRTIGALLKAGATGRREATLMVADLANRGIATLTAQELENVLKQITVGAVACREGELPIKRGPKKRHARFPTLWDETRDPGPWPFVQAACLLPIPAVYRDQRANLISQAELDERSGVIAAALCELTDAKNDCRPLGATGASAVNAALAIPLPPKSETIRESRRRYSAVGGGRPASGLPQVALAACDHLDELAEGSGERLFQISMISPGSLADGIFGALKRAGVDVSRRWAGLTRVNSWFATHREHEAKLLSDLISLSDSESNSEDAGFWSLTEVGDLITATGYQEVGVGEFARAFDHDSAEDRRRWLGALADAYSIDKSAVAQQARYMKQVNENEDNANSPTRDWFVATSKPLVDPSPLSNLDSALSHEQQKTLISCLEADSDWIAGSAAHVLMNVKNPHWDSRELFNKDMSDWPRWRAGILYMVAIFTAGDECGTLLNEAAISESSDYRYAARMAISIVPGIDPGKLMLATLQRDPDLSVRPKNSRKMLPAPTHWSCNDCRAVNEMSVEDCPECKDGVRPDA